MPKEATQFEKGKSGNPGGRPKGLARRIRERISEDDLIDFHLAVVTMDAKLMEALQISKGEIKLADRQKSVDWLTERGHGKAPQHEPVKDGDPLELSDTERAIDQAVDELATRRATQIARPATNGKVAARGANGK